MFVLAFVFGALIGSFLNVCIYRIPAGESVVYPRSRCSACRTPIRPWDNIPMLSWLWLRGRCRACGAKFSPRYLLVEFLTGLAAMAVLAHFGWTATAAVSFVFVAALIVITFIDLDHQIIPDVISLPGIVVGLVAAIVLGEPPWTDSLIGLLLGGGALWAVAEGYYRLTGRDGMGGGDIKLLAMVGAFLGWRAVPVTLLVGSLAGSLIGIALITLHGGDRRAAIPFGPFLAAGAVSALFFGQQLIDWYLGLAMPTA